MPVVNHKLVTANGTAIAGATVSLRLVVSGYDSSASSELYGSQTTTTDATGAYTFTLTGNSALSPTGTYYVVTHPNGEQLTFTVPATGGPYWLFNLLVANPASPATAGVLASSGYGSLGYVMPVTTGGDAIVTPVNAAFATATTGGTLAAGTYWYRVSAINSRGETIASTETSQVTTGSTSTVTVNWGAVTGATGYKVYGRTTGAELLIATVGAVTTYIDTGAITPSGALPTANTTSGDDTALFTAAEAALPAGGGEIRLQAGTYSLPTGYSFTKQVNLVGQGMGDPYGYQPGPGFPNPAGVRGITTILCGSTTANALTINGQASTFRDFTIVNTTPTCTAGSGINVTSGNLARLDRVGISNFYDLVVYTDGELLVMRDCFTVEAVRYHVRYSNVTVVDGGDAEIQGNSFYQVTRTATAGIFWQSGGGPRIQGNKVNCVAGKITSGISLDPLGTTTVFLIQGNSLENCTVGINFNRTSGSSNIGQILINDNEFGNHQYGILVQSAGFSLMNIADNIIKACTTTGISLANTANIHVASNHHNTYTGSSNPVTVAATCTNVQVDPQYVDTGNVYLNSATATVSGATFDGRFFLALPTINTTDVTLFRLGVAIVTAGVIEFTLGGQLVSVGQFMHNGVRSFTRGASGVATVATIGTDNTIGTTADWTLTFDTSAVTGEIQVKLKRTTATAITGTIELDIHGPLASVRIGA
jgi:hypothetical protein